MKSLVGYESDSDDEKVLPAVSTSAARPGPVQSSAAKRKAESRGRLQVRVSTALNERDTSDTEQASSTSEEVAKRPKLSTSGRPKHSLLNALPAPRRAVTAESHDGKTSPTVGLEAAAERASDVVPRPQDNADQKSVSVRPSRERKGNNAFRAMLGLSAGSGSASIASDSASIASGSAQPPSVKPEKLNTSAHTTVASDAPRPHAIGREASQRKHLRSLHQMHPPSEALAEADDTAKGLSTSSDTSAPSSMPQAKAAVIRAAASAAPDVEDDAGTEPEPPEEPQDDPFAGWQMNPDGTWYPVTPEAIAAYEAHARVAASSQAQLDKDAADTADMPSVDVNKEYTGTSSTGRDAEAAASAPIRSQGRARHKGQLSSLVSIAAEKRGELENKWARTKQGMSNASSKYGF